MNCSRARNILTAGEEAAMGQLAQHLESCLSCRTFAARMESVRAELRGFRPTIEPDGAFSARVLQRLSEQAPLQATDLLGWAALRLLPIALLLTVLLGGWTLLTQPDPESLQASVDQDPLAWIVNEEADGS